MMVVSVECLYAVCVGVGLLFGSLWQDYEETILKTKLAQWFVEFHLLTNQTSNMLHMKCHCS